jgi:hypothetical protein
VRWRFVREDVLRGSAGTAAFVSEFSRDELIRYFTSATGDVAFVDTGRGRGAADRLGMLVQLCTLPWLGFVPARYDGYLEKARKSGEDTAYRHYWELCVTLCLRDGLRSGDVFVPGSRRYADPSTYLYTPAAVIDRIAADVDELARAWRVQDLTTAAVLPGPRAERRRRLAEPDLEFRAFCTRRSGPGTPGRPSDTSAARSASGPATPATRSGHANAPAPPGQFRKLDAVAVLTGPLLPAPRDRDDCARVLRRPAR